MRIWIKKAACVVACTLLLAGCGDTDDTQPNAALHDEGSTTATDEPTRLPIAAAIPRLPTASISNVAKLDRDAVSSEATAEPVGPNSTPNAVEFQTATAEQLVREITNLRLQPFAETDDVEMQKQARKQRNEKIVHLAEQAIAFSFKDEGKRRIFQVAVHHLLGAQLQLALQGDPQNIEELYANAELMNQRFPQTKVAAEAAFTVATFAHRNAQRFATHEPRWLTEFANQAQLFAQNFPQETGRGVPLLFAAAQTCDLHGMSGEALKCYISLQERFPDSPRATQVTASIRRLNLKNQELKLAGPTIDGGFVSVDSYRGKVVLIVYWATHVKPFVEQLPRLLAIIAKFQQSQLQVIGVNLDQEEPAVDAFLEKHPIDWPQIFYSDRNRRAWNHPLASMYGIRNPPALWLVDPHSVVLETHLNLQKLEARLDSILGPEPESNPAK